MLYVFVLLAVLLITVVPAYAAAPPYFLNGTVNRSDTMTGLNAVTVTLNGTNSTTTDATGAFSLDAQNGTYSVVITVPNDGYEATTALTGVMNAASNTTLKRNLTLVTPVISGVTESSVGRVGATLSWTTNINTIGNRVVYTRDSALTNNLWTADWSNSTTSPSFVLSGLDIFTKYYYQMQSYNTNNGSYSDTEDGDFTTLAGNPDEEPESYELVSIPQSGQQYTPSIVTQAQNKVTKSKTNKVIAFGIIVIVLYMVLGGNKKKK